STCRRPARETAPPTVHCMIVHVCRKPFRLAFQGALRHVRRSPPAAARSAIGGSWPQKLKVVRRPTRLCGSRHHGASTGWSRGFAVPLGTARKPPTCSSAPCLNRYRENQPIRHCPGNTTSASMLHGCGRHVADICKHTVLSYSGDGPALRSCGAGTLS